MLKTPKATIALFCTGSYAATKAQPSAVQQYLQDNWQLHSVFQKDCYTPLSAEQRADIFLDYLFDKNIKALWALRGGEGSADVIPFIEKQRQKIAQLSPKPIIGFSDITPLLIYFAQTFNWPTVHGPCALQLILKNSLNKKSQKTLYQLLSGKQCHLHFPALSPLNSAAATMKPIHSEITGGNLSLLNISIKDCWEFEAANKILLIEEVNEKPHTIRRTLNYLQRLGKLQNAQAILLGGFTYAPNKKIQQEIQQVLNKFAANCSTPVFKTDQFGHGKKNMPLYFGKPAMIDKTHHLTF